MDVLLKQLRTKYPRDGQGSRERTSPSRDQKLQPQKTESFKGDKRRTQSWIRRQITWQTSQDHDPIAGGDYQTAVAAAAFAIKSLEESRKRDQKMGHQWSDASSSFKTKLKTGDTAHLPEPRTKSLRFSEEVSKPNQDVQDKKVQESPETNESPPEKVLGLVPSIKKKQSFEETVPPPQTESQSVSSTKKKLSFADTAPPPQPESRSVPSTKKKLSFADSIPPPQPESSSLPADEVIGMIPSIKNPLNLPDKRINRDFSKKEAPEPRLDVPAVEEPPFLPVNARKQVSENPGVGDEADEWEKSEISRIKDKYEKLNATILEWENKKKRKAKNRLDRTQAEVDKRRAKATQQYRSELARIDGIAGGARSQAIENRKKEELKVKEKANKIRLTGKVPATCLCC